MHKAIHGSVGPSADSSFAASDSGQVALQYEHEHLERRSQKATEVGYVQRTGSPMAKGKSLYGISITGQPVEASIKSR